MEIVIKKVFSYEDAVIANKFLIKLIEDEKQYDDNINDKIIVSTYYEQFYNQSEHCILLAQVGEITIGYLYGFIINNNAYIKKIAQLDAMYVDQEYRGKHVGPLLIEAFNRWCFDNGVSYIELKVCKNNKIAVELYKKNNFKETKIIMQKECEL
jgi:ribosomal protein S18 acetylase RimI-like enzyme